MFKLSQTKSGDIIIRITGPDLRHAVKMLEECPEGTRVTHTKTFSDAVLSTLREEQEDGTTLVHLMLDRALEAAIENGADGVRLGSDDD